MNQLPRKIQQEIIKHLPNKKNSDGFVKHGINWLLNQLLQSDLNLMSKPKQY